MKRVSREFSCSKMRVWWEPHDSNIKALNDDISVKKSIPFSTYNYAVTIKRIILNKEV